MEIKFDGGAKKINVVVIAGIRSQFMKVAALQRAAKIWDKSSREPISLTYLNTGQHYDFGLSKVFLDELDINFDVDFTGTYSSFDSTQIFAEMLIKLERWFEEANFPIDWVIVFGDANTTLAGALAASRKGYRVIHVEAGVRTGYRSPEEVNRIVTDHIAELHLVTSKRYLSVLAEEGIRNSVVWTGDLIGDLVRELEPDLPSCLEGYLANEYILASLHRKENLNSEVVLRNLVEFLTRYKMKVVFITHPSTRARLQELNLYNNLDNIDYLDMLPYRQMLGTIKGCCFLVTDSGAFQREAYYLKKRCLTRQDEEHWVSLIEAGIHRTIGRTTKDIEEGFEWMEKRINEPYPEITDLGDGCAGKHIFQAIVEASK